MLRLIFQELEQVLPYNKSLFDAKEYFKKILNSIGVRLKQFSLTQFDSKLV